MYNIILCYIILYYNTKQYLVPYVCTYGTQNRSDRINVCLKDELRCLDKIKLEINLYKIRAV